MASGRSQIRDEEPLTLRERLDERLDQVQYLTYTALVAVLLLLGFLWPRMFITIPTGSQGVMFRFFAGGTVTDRVWGEGLHIIPPWDYLTQYEVRLQQRMLSFDVLSDEGLDLQVDVSVRFRPISEMLGYIHRDIGPDYFERMIEPDIRAHVRRTFGNRTAHEIYSSANDLLLELRQVPLLGRLDVLKDEEGQPYVEIQEIKLVDLKLPEVVLAGIAEKYRQEQLMLEYRHKLGREEAEAERKRTEAAGIRDYNLIIGELSPDVLRWRDLEATSELAKSPNAKVLVLGGGGSGTGTSLLFNVGGDSTLPAVTTPTPPTPATPANAIPAASTTTTTTAPAASSTTVPATPAPATSQAP